MKFNLFSFVLASSFFYLGSAQAAVPSNYVAHCIAMTDEMKKGEAVEGVDVNLISGETLVILETQDLKFSVSYKTNKYSQAFIELKIRNLVTEREAINDVTFYGMDPVKTSLVSESGHVIGCFPL